MIKVENKFVQRVQNDIYIARRLRNAIGRSPTKYMSEIYQKHAQLQKLTLDSTLLRSMSSSYGKEWTRGKEL